MTVDAVVFDIGNVLLEWNPEAFFDRVYGQGLRERLFAEVDLEGMNLRIDGGAPLAETAEAMAADHPDHAEQILCWRDRWLEMAGPAIEGGVATLRGLKEKGIPVYALSNFGAETFAMAPQKFPFLTEFDHATISAHVGANKPDPAIYAALEKATGADPLGLLFVDDKVENLEAAAARGWQIHHSTSPEGWAKRLIYEGILDEAAL